MKLIKFKKIGLDKYKVFFDETELILYEDVILKYNLLTTHDIDLQKIEKIIEENKYYEVYNMALKYIAIKLRSKNEIISFLEKKDIESKLIKEVIEKLEYNGYLNEEVFINAFINDSVNLKSDGPYKIKSNLMNLGLNEDLIDKYLSKIDNSVWEEKISKHINKAVNLNKKYSKDMIKQKISFDLYNKGYENSMIDKALENISLNDEDNLKKEYDKAYKKYSNKYSGRDLNNKIYTYMQRKGYNYYDIKKELDN